MCSETEALPLLTELRITVIASLTHNHISHCFTKRRKRKHKYCYFYSYSSIVMDYALLFSVFKRLTIYFFSHPKFFLPLAI